nr:HAD family hydrolase [uncultured Mediterraneibacter sp.]
MERAVLFFDIDGTVLSEVTKEVPQSAVEAMEKARAEGHLLFINTGRTICSIPPEVRRFQFDGYLCGCGTYLTEHDEVLLESSIEKQRGRDLLKKAKECNLGVIAEGQEDCYFSGVVSRFDRLESTRRYFAERGIGIEQSLERGDFVYDKLFVYADDKSDFESFRKYLGDDMEALDRGGKAYEVIQKGFSKATACQFIMERYGMDASHAYVFGDSSNDLAMFEYAEHAIAMGRHDSVLDPHAEFVTKTVENDGIAYAMKHYGLI